MLALAVGAGAGALAKQQLALTALAVAGILQLLAWVLGSRERSRLEGTKKLSSRTSSLASVCSAGASPDDVSKSSRQLASSSGNGFVWQEVRPPLPEAVVFLLRSTRLGYLSTATQECGNTSPHLSLMNFTYVPGDEVIVMTTRRDTQKYYNLLAQPKVALLVHDFPTLRDQEEKCHGRTYSITLYGKVALPQHQKQEEKYRQLHLDNNPGSRNFIVGDNIAVLIVCVECARLCNSDDKVTMWSAQENAQGSKS
eukprot:TRINITY_DN5578_c0_g2_i1.p1 TRINITY_DN5578_c0_g2~~TRINITY_DN5578_c0_g2_i1.p1  ORF type:complete len:279 (+),score=54.28 TRINITY_DN5578_c0_g2_i1:76-837(+)